MRDHRKLKAFELSDLLVLNVYRVTKAWPKEEVYGLTSQVRRASLSIASNIVERAGRSSQREYLRFIEVVLGSAREVLYQLSVARRLDMPVDNLEVQAEECCRVLAGLHRSMTSSSLKPQGSS